MALRGDRDALSVPVAGWVPASVWSRDNPLTDGAILKQVTCLADLMVEDDVGCRRPSRICFESLTGVITPQACPASAPHRAARIVPQDTINSKQTNTSKTP